MEKKYELTEEKKMMKDGAIVQRIRYLKDFKRKEVGLIKAGTLGGWIEKEENLSQEGTCVVLHDAIVSGAAKVEDNAAILGYVYVWGNRMDKYLFTKSSIRISGDAIIRGYASISEGVTISDRAYIADHVTLYGSAKVYGDACLWSHACVSGHAEIYDYASISDDASVSQNAQVYENSHISGNAYIYGDAKVYGNAIINGDVAIDGYAKVYGHTKVSGNSRISNNAIVFHPNELNITSEANFRHNAQINSSNDYLVIGPIGSRHSYTTFYLTSDMTIMVACGCFNDTIDVFEKEVIKKYHDINSMYEREYLAAIEYVRKVYKS